MLIAFHHHAEARNQDAPWDVPRAELMQHAFINIVHVQGALSGLLAVAVVEGEGLRACFVLCKACFSVLLAALCIFLEEQLVQGSRRRLRDRGRCNSRVKVLLELALLACDFFLEP